MPQTIEASARTRTLGSKYYTSDEIFAEEKTKIFFKSWQYACHSSKLKKPGSYITISLFDQNIFLVRTMAGEIKGYYNVCPHRGHQLLQGEGQKKTIMCPYHAWTFSTEGKLLGARAVQNTSELTKDEICLFPIRVEQVIDFVFINLDLDSKPLSEFAPDLADQVLEGCPDIRSYQLVKSDKEVTGSYVWEANWKVMIDNYLECYHCRTTHPLFSEILDMEATQFTLMKNLIGQTIPVTMKTENKAFPLNLEHDLTTSYAWLLFPNIAITRFPGVPAIYISRFDPISVDKTIRIIETLMPKEMPDPDAERRNLLRKEYFSNYPIPEDKAACESVQAGMSQMGYTKGWYINDFETHEISEHAMYYFHDLYLDAMK